MKIFRLAALLALAAAIPLILKSVKKTEPIRAVESDDMLNLELYGM
jgi:hypothetical protein